MSFVVGLVNEGLERLWKLKEWVEPHLWVLTTVGLTVSLPLLIAGNVNKQALLAHNGRLRDSLGESKRDTLSAEIESRLIAMDTGKTGKELEEEEFAFA